MGNFPSPLFVELEIGLVFGLGDVSRNVAKHAPHLRETDCVAGVVGLELRNVVANYPFERSRRFPESSRILALETIRV